MSRLDVLTSRKGNDGKTYYTKIGVAFPRDRGGYSVKLEALPLNGELLLSPPLPKRGETGGQREPGDDTGEQPNW